MRRSIERAIILLNTPQQLENYSLIKLRPVEGGCCCFHCWPEPWQAINNYIGSQGFIEDEGDVLLSLKGEKVVLECHESGPEIILYGTISSLLAYAIIEVIKVFTRTLKHRYRHGVKIVKRVMVDKEVIEKELTINFSDVDVEKIKFEIYSLIILDLAKENNQNNIKEDKGSTLRNQESP